MERWVKSGFAVDGEDGEGLTPLQVAARYGHSRAAETLLSLGADVEKTSTRGVTPLQRAAGNGRLDVVRLFLSRGASLEPGAGTWRSPLFLATRADSAEVIALLLEHGVDPDMKLPDGTAPLHFAAAFGSRESARFLLSRGADIHAVCRWDSNHTRHFGRDAHRYPPSGDEMDGGTPLHIAAARGDRETADLFIASGAGMDIMAAAGLGLTRFVEDALHQDRSLAGSRWYAGDTPMHWAARNGALEVVKLLAGCSAEIDARNEREETPLHLASYGGHAPVVDFLCGEGADLDAATNDGETPLFLAAGRGATGVVRLLSSLGADLDASCNWSAPTALLIAAHTGNAETAEYLVSRGANGLVRSRFGDVLEDLVMGGNKHLAEKLRAYRIGCLEKACLRTDRRLLWIDDFIGDFHVPLLEFAHRIGFGLAESSSSDQALLILENPHERIDLLIQDLQRPHGACLTAKETDDGELSGLAFYSKHARRLRPDLPCIFVTGNPTDPKLLASLSEWPSCRVAAKPLDWGLLGMMVQEMTGIPPAPA
ncbi:MAG: hypothetical protein A2177_06150 [Spirochaetes bacterium RBG_13_68_11]|nr:MAG: hypothetical protein A2177_06150 [Spirochaetes bacterium RBG_13_68_11]